MVDSFLKDKLPVQEVYPEHPDILFGKQLANPLNVQVAGNHYKSKAIQPVEYIAANNLNFLEGCIVKRITRWRDKDGIKDLEKIKHEIDLLIDMEKKYGCLKDKGQNGENAAA